MTHYFIDTDDGNFSALDEEGHDLPDASAARRLALRALSDMVADTLSDGDRRVLTVRVREADGEPVYAAELALSGEWLREPSGRADGGTL